MPEFIPSAASRAKGEEIAKLRRQIADIFAAHRSGDGFDMPAEKVGELRGLNEEVAAKAALYDAALDLEKGAWDNEQALRGLTNLRPAMPPDGLGGPVEAKIVPFSARLAARSAELKSLAAGGNGTITFDLNAAETKTLTSASIAPQAERVAVVPSAQFLADVTDLFLPGTTERDAVDFYEETVFTNTAAETTEGAAAPQATLDFALRNFPVRELSVFLPVTRRALDDTAGLGAYVEGRLGHMVNMRRSAQLLVGNGVAPNLRGILATSGIQTVAAGSDPVPNAIYRALVLARTTGDAEPTGVIVHALDWQDIRLLRTIDGIYVWGNPSEAGPERIWGLDVRVSNSITQNTGLVGAFRPFAQVYRREGLTIEISTEHASFFIERRAAILAYERLALAVYRPAAFVTVTGI